MFCERRIWGGLALGVLSLSVVSAEAQSTLEGPTEVAPPEGEPQATTPTTEVPLESGDDPATTDEQIRVLKDRARGKRARWRHMNNATAALPKKADVLALTVSGGVSLGSHEAGMIHLLTEALRRSPNSARLKVVTGASAGSANALIAATSACRTTVEEPHESLGYRVWIPVGFDQLFDPGQVTAGSLFTQDPMGTGYSEIANVWRRGLPETCDFVFGAAVTRESGYDVELAPGLAVPRQSERFVVRVTGRKAAAPIFENYLDITQNFERPLLPLTAGDDQRGLQDMKAIRQLVLASAAFPIAFEAVPIEHCTTAKRSQLSSELPTTPPHCEQATRVDPFVDGGVFDNNPLGSAYQTATDGLVMGVDGPQFRPVPTGGPEDLPEIIFGFVDPDLRNYTRYEPQRIVEDDNSDPLLSLLARLGGQAMKSARGQELATLAEKNPYALSRLWLMEASYPPTGELLAAFFGFFERDFRDFDFHLGSYDAYRNLRDQSGSLLGVEPFLDGMADTLQGSVKDIPSRYRKLGCILGYVEPDRHERLKGLCEGDDLQNFRILLQVSIDRLWSNCRRLTEEEVGQHEHMQCKRAHGGIAPPRVDVNFKVKGSRFQEEKEDDFSYAMRLLGDYHFTFRDLELTAKQSHRGRIAVRSKLAQAVNSLGDAQPGFSNRTAVLTAGRMMVNRIAYEPPPKRWYLMLGSSLAVGYLHQMGNSGPFFWNADARHFSMRSLITNPPEEFAGTLSFGVELAILPISGSILQFSLAARGGYQFAVMDSIGVEPCDEEEAQSDSRRCSQAVLHVPFSLTVLERLRVTAMPVLYLQKEPFGHDFFNLEIGFGGEFF